MRDEAPFEWTLAVREGGATPPPTRILHRGNTATPGAEVQPAFLRVVTTEPPRLPTPPGDALSSGRRRALADWIAKPTHGHC